MSLPLADGSDAELVALALGGKQDAFRELMTRYREPVFRLVRATTGDPSEALDLTQEVFISAFFALHRFDTSRPLAVWLRKIALNKCRDWARRRKVRSFFTRAAPLELAYSIAADVVPHDLAAADRAELARVTAAIGNLPTRLREVLVLCAVDELTQADAAAVLGVTVKAVETRLYRARVRLNEILANPM
ncbi:MAG: RNA polymerase sigma factor [Croceibacterium sp.]